MVLMELLVNLIVFLLFVIFLSIKNIFFHRDVYYKLTYEYENELKTRMYTHNNYKQAEIDFLRFTLDSNYQNVSLNLAEK